MFTDKCFTNKFFLFVNYVDSLRCIAGSVVNDNVQCLPRPTGALQTVAKHMLCCVIQAEERIWTLIPFDKMLQYMLKVGKDLQ